MKALDELLVSYIGISPKDVAATLESIESLETVEFLVGLSDEVLLMLLPHLNKYLAAKVLSGVSDERSAVLLRNFLPAEGFAVLNLMALESRNKTLHAMGERKAAKFKKMARAAGKTALSHMDASLLPFNEETLVSECVKAIRSGRRTFYYLYIVDSEDGLVGICNINSVLLKENADTTLKLIMEKDVQRLRSDETPQEILANPGWQNFFSLPVVDVANRYLGILSYRSLKAIEAEIQGGSREHDMKRTAQALGELYALGLNTLMGSGLDVLDKGRQ